MKLYEDKIRVKPDELLSDFAEQQNVEDFMTFLKTQHNLSQLLSAFDELIVSYFLKGDNFDYKESQSNLTILLPQIIELSPNFLSQKLENYFINKNYEQLFKLAEFLRVIGIYEEMPILWNKRNEILSMMLKISHSLFEHKTVEITQNAYYLFFVKTVFDIIFHQVRFSEYEPTVKVDYLKLCNEVLDEKYHYLFEHEIREYYYQIIHFIELGDGKFEKEALLELLPKIQKLTTKNSSFNEWIENIEERLRK